MGYSRWDQEEYTSSFAPSRSTMSREQIFTRRSIDNGMNPKGVQFREARDSDTNPETTPIIIGLDVTGSMGYIPEYMVKDGLGRMVSEILERRPITDPTVLIAGIGDAMMRDRAPLQVGQFESDLVIANWLEALYLEGGGGGNGIESYDLAYYFGAFHTRTDAHELRNRPGVIITIGDEGPNPVTKREHVAEIIGGSIEIDVQFSDLIQTVRQMYIPYHIIISEGSHASTYGAERLQRDWGNYLGQNALILSNHRMIAQLIVSILEIEAGRSVQDAINTWSGETQRILQESLRGFSPDTSLNGPRLPRRLDA